jgi:hypothetical protein
MYSTSNIYTSLITITVLRKQMWLLLRRHILLKILNCRPVLVLGRQIFAHLIFR